MVHGGFDEHQELEGKAAAGLQLSELNITAAEASSRHLQPGAGLILFLITRVCSPPPAER